MRYTIRFLKGVLALRYFVMAISMCLQLDEAFNSSLAEFVWTGLLMGASAAGYAMILTED